MKYPNGDQIKVGDILQLWEGCEGIVVCSIEDSVYSSEFTENDWAYLKEGILIKSDSAGIIHYTEPEESFKLLKRK